MPRRIALVAVFMALVGGLCGVTARSDEPPAYEAYAVRYATFRDFAVSNLVQGADPKRKLDIAMTIWVLKAPGGKTVLVDAGFYQPRYSAGGRIADYTRPDKALERLGIKPEEVTDIIATHMHWDHVDGLDLFPNAQVWIQRAEFDHYTVDARRPAADQKHEQPEYVLALMKLESKGRVHKVDGDAKEIIPGITVYTGGRHTFASQYVGANTRAGRMVIASDNLYLYENLDKHVPIAQTFDAKANLAAQDRMKQIATNPRLIIPGHDPEVFVRFPKPGNGVARLD
jgi:glyoxylase-like metal-dependent hydrolase (beta-lactamase superfamily II)